MGRCEGFLPMFGLEVCFFFYGFFWMIEEMGYSDRRELDQTRIIQSDLTTHNNNLVHLFERAATVYSVYAG